MSKKDSIYYLPIARKDLMDIIEYIQEDNPNAALKFLDQIENTISKLETFPYMGATPKDTLLQFKGYRILVIQSYLAVNLAVMRCWLLACIGYHINLYKSIF